MSETRITTEIAEIILGAVSNPRYPGLKDLICREYHISRGMLTTQKLLRMNSITFFRLMYAIAQNVAPKDYNDMLEKLKEKTLSVAEMEDDTYEEIKKAHAGSPIGKKRKKKSKNTNF